MLFPFGILFDVNVICQYRPAYRHNGKGAIGYMKEYFSSPKTTLHPAHNSRPYGYAYTYYQRGDKVRREYPEHCQ